MWVPENGHYSRVHEFDEQKANFPYSISISVSESPPSCEYKL